MAGAPVQSCQPPVPRTNLWENLEDTLLLKLDLQWAGRCPSGESLFAIRSDFCFHIKRSQKTPYSQPQLCFPEVYSPLSSNTSFHIKIWKTCKFCWRKKWPLRSRKGRKNTLRLKLFGLPKKQNISYHESHMWPLSFGKGHLSLPMGGQNLQDLAQMARGTWNLTLD